MNILKRLPQHLSIIGLGLLVRIPFLFFPLTYGHEVWRQSDTASIARNFLLNGYNILYPQILWGGSGPGYVETEFQIYPFLVAMLYGLFGEQLWLGRFVSILFGAVSSYVFYLLARQVFQEKIAIWALAFFVLSPLNIRYGVAFMPESAMLCFFVLGLFWIQSWLESNSVWKLLASAVAVSVAVLLKATALIAAPIMAIMIVQHSGLKALRSFRLWIVAAVALLPPLAWYLHARNLYLEYGNTFGILSGGDWKFGRFEYWLDPSFYASLLRLETIWVFAGFALPVALLGLLQATRKRSYGIIWIGWIIIILYFLAVARYAGADYGVHYHLFAVPFAALAFGAGVEWLQEKLNGRVRNILSFILAAAFIGSTAAALYLMLRPAGNRAGQDLIRYGNLVGQLVPMNEKIVVSSPYSEIQDGVANNYQEPSIFFYARRTGWSLPANRHTPEEVKRFRLEGAGWFVIYDRRVYDARPELMQYLKTNADQIGPGIDSGCAVFRLKY